jgi:hypothetical protein
VVGGEIEIEISCNETERGCFRGQGLARLRPSLPEVPPATSGEGHVTCTSLQFHFEDEDNFSQV